MYRNANVSGLYDRIVPLGVQNLYAMLALADERRIRTAYSAENKPTGQTANRIVMGISTLVFPRMLLYGWIAPEGISVSMSADNPSEFTISFTLIVTSTTPKIGYDGYQSLVSSYKNNMFTQSTTLDWMAATVPSSDRSVAAGIRAAGKPPDPPMADPSSAGGNNHMLDDTISTSSSTTSV